MQGAHTAANGGGGERSRAAHPRQQQRPATQLDCSRESFFFRIAIIIVSVSGSAIFAILPMSGVFVVLTVSCLLIAIFMLVVGLYMALNI